MEDTGKAPLWRHLQIGDFVFRWGQVFYEWTGDRVNTDEDDVLCPTEEIAGEEPPVDPEEELDPDEPDFDPAFVTSRDFTYKLWFPGECRLETAQALRKRLNKELVKAPDLVMLRRLTDDAQSERFKIVKGWLEGSDFTFLLSKRRTLTMTLNLNVKLEKFVTELLPLTMQMSFPGVTLEGEGEDGLTALDVGGDTSFPGTDRVEG